ncbi:hypothetical protein CR513_11636, partial [Mucuna pruriens]
MQLSSFAKHIKGPIHHGSQIIWPIVTPLGMLTYRRLRNEKEFYEEILEREVKKTRAWLKLRALAGRRRPRLRVAPLRRFLRRRTKFLSRFRISWRNTFKKLKNGQSHGNVTPFGCAKKP